MLANSDIPFAALTDIAAGLKNRSLSSVSVTELMLARIASVDPQLHSFLSVTTDDALAQARQAETEIAAGRYRGPLHGVPIAIKDLFYTAGVPATFGSMAYKEFRSDYTATIIDRLIAAGAVILGRLALHEGALAEHHPGFGEAPTHPYVAGFWPGGSSSGSGVATAAGLCFASLGSDTGGSIRFPCAANGLTGLKPTWGRVSRYGVFTLANSLDTVGPMARSAADAAALFDVIAGHDMNDPTSLTAPVPNYLAALDGVFGARDLKIGIDWDYVGGGTDPEIVDSLKQALAVFESIGAQIVPISMPSVVEVTRLQQIIMETECANYHKERFAADPSEFGKLREVIERGLNYEPVQVASAYIEKDRFKGELLKVFDCVDSIAMPVMQKVGIRYDEMDAVMEDIPSLGRFTGPYNMTGSPTITFPTGMSNSGLPLAMQLVGRHLSEASLFKTAHAFQQATSWHQQRPKLQ
jgi:amidase